MTGEASMNSGISGPSAVQRLVWIGGAVITAIAATAAAVLAVVFAATDGVSLASGVASVLIVTAAV